MLREPCSVDKVYVLPLGTPEFPLKICTECFVKKLVLEAVFGRTTHAQNSRVEANSFSVVYSYIFMQECLVIKTVLRIKDHCGNYSLYIYRLFFCSVMVWMFCNIVVVPSHSFLMPELIYFTYMIFITQCFFCGL